MLKKQHYLIFFFTLSSFYLSGCAPQKVPPSQGGFYYSGVYFGKNFSATFKKGIEDGCITAKGEYQKSHTLFKTDQDYNDGWFLGRNRCKHLLVMDE